MSQVDIVRTGFLKFLAENRFEGRETGEEAMAGIHVSDDGLDPSVVTGVGRDQFLAMRWL